MIVRRRVAAGSATALVQSLAVWFALVLSLATAGGAWGRPVGCRAYPRPGTAAGGGTPSDLAAEYGVLRRRQRSADRLAVRWLRSLPESGIVPGGVRFLARATYGRVYLVPARHVLAFPLGPARCLPRAKRALQRKLLPQLRSQYAHHALCLVIIFDQQESPTCGSAPGTFDPLLYGPGSPGFGMAPDGVAAVRVHFLGTPSKRVRVHRNLWIVNDALAFKTPCGVDWLDARGTVLRTVQTCNTSDTT